PGRAPAGAFGHRAHHRDVAPTRDEGPTAAGDPGPDGISEVQQPGVIGRGRTVDADPASGPRAHVRSTPRCSSPYRSSRCSEVVTARRCASRMNSTESATRTSSVAGAAIRPCSTSVPRIQSASGLQTSTPSSTIGNLVIVSVWTSVMASKNSSSVPNPPGVHTNACVYLTNIVLRTKKYRKCRPKSTQRLTPCSCGSSMPRPTDLPSASHAPLLAASICPGPPPVTTAYPASASARPSPTACS